MYLGHFDVNLATCIAASILCAATGCVALARDARSPAYRSFAFGMAVMTGETIVSYLAMNASTPEQALMWSRWGLNVAALLPGSWLVFSLSYARRNFDEFSSTWKWALIAAFVVPVGLASLGWNNLFGPYAEVSDIGYWIMPIGLCGRVFYVTLLLCSVLILANLEKTLRATRGAIRWQIKFSILAAAVIFAAQIYVCAHVLMFSCLRSEFFGFNAITLIFANVLFIISGVRSELRDVRVYVPRDVFRGSLTTLVVGAYLIGVGLFAKLTVYLGVGMPALGVGLFIFFALLGASVLLLSGALRYKLLRFIHIHFLRPRYDYRKIWADFTRQTSSWVDIDHVCEAIVKTVSDAFTSPAVTIWLFEDSLDRPVLGASTALLPEEAEGGEKLAASLWGFVRDQRAPYDRENANGSPAISTELLKEAGIRYCVALSAGGEFLGMLTMGERSGRAFSVEDFDLLQTFADQAAELILNHKLFESLGQAREVEAFQALSTFFVHDLKNVASTLSLTLSNLPIHYGDPAFRADTLKIMTKSVEKIRDMCGRLSALERKVNLSERECDLNELISGVLSDLKVSNPLIAELQPVPVISLDPEQIRKVVVNLVLNGCESSGSGGEILVSTSSEGDWLRFSVTDRGCGMSSEFMDKSLFRPFRTIKNGGSGIGLYQSRMIVEAHGGRIEARSREGQGSSFSVFLPLRGQNP